jgi:hypothetical protein
VNRCRWCKGPIVYDEWSGWSHADLGQMMGPLHVTLRFWCGEGQTERVAPESRDA